MKGNWWYDRSCFTDKRADQPETSTPRRGHVVQIFGSLWLLAGTHTRPSQRGPQCKLSICLPNGWCCRGNKNDSLCTFWQQMSDSLIPHQPLAPHGHRVKSQQSGLMKEAEHSHSPAAAPLRCGEKREPGTWIPKSKDQKEILRPLGQTLHFSDGE